MESAKFTTKDATLNSILDWIYQNGMGNIINLTAVPTPSNMNANTFGFYNGYLYMKLSTGTLWKIQFTQVT